MSNAVKIVLSGPGLIGRQHARLIRARPDCELAALVGPPTEENVSFAAELATPLLADLGQALSITQADAAIVSSPNACHFEQAMLCVDRRIPVLVEKPVTDDLDDARRLMGHAETAHVPVLVGHHRTYSPLLEAADGFLGSERFGQLVAMQASAVFYKPAHYFVEGAWRTRKGGGPILINLIHEIGLMRHFCGEIRSVFAMAGRNVRKFEVEDTVAITLEFVNGALGTFLLSDTGASSKSWEMTSGENKSYPHFADQYCYHFAGTRGSLDFPSMQARYYADGVDPSWWNPFSEERIAFTPDDPLPRQLAHFVQVIRGQAAPRVSARDGYMNMLVVQAITRSIATRSVVDFGADAA